MTGSSTGRVLLGVATLFPLAYMGWFFWLVFSGLATGGPPLDEEQFRTLFAVHLAVMALGVGLLVFYIVHLFRTDAIANDKKVLWALVLFFGGALAMIVYWYLYLWRGRPATGARSRF